MIILWMSGLSWKIAQRMPITDVLRAKGAIVRNLEPLPITGQQSQVWQMLSGQNPAQTGFFDVWLPQEYAVQPVTEPKARVSLLQEMIAAGGLTATLVELALTEVPAYLKKETASADCLIVQTAVNDESDIVAIEEAIKVARAWAGSDGTFLLLSEYQEAAIKCYVNLNDGLHALDVLEVSAQKTIHWEETLAYHAGHGQLWINLEGREHSGTIASGNEYDQTCQALIRALPAKLLDPQTGEPVIERIYRRDELYHGDFLFRAPDLVVVLRPGYAPSPNSIAVGLDGMAVWPAPIGTHAAAGLQPTTVAGLALAIGTPFAVGQVIGQSSLLNVAPTILHALHLPIPTSIDAQVITDLFTSAFMQQFPVQRADPAPDLSVEDEEEIIERLKSLGYL
jgi:hypothetical protein